MGWSFMQQGGQQAGSGMDLVTRRVKPCGRESKGEWIGRRVGRV